MSLYEGVFMCHVCVRGPCVGLSIVALAVPYRRLSSSRWAEGCAPSCFFFLSVPVNLWYFYRQKYGAYIQHPAPPTSRTQLSVPVRGPHSSQAEGPFSVPSSPETGSDTLSFLVLAFPLVVQSSSLD